MPYNSRRIFFRHCEFNVPDNVYAPAEDSILFAENLNPREKDIVLDMGTGCGILGIVAAKKASEVLAIDINPYAVQCARENAVLNSVTDKIFLLRSDLFAALDTGQKFTLVLFNSPYLPVENEDRSWLGTAWSGGFNGRAVIDRFINGVVEHLALNGEVLLMQSSLSGIEETLDSFSKNSLEARIVASHDLPFFETITLIGARFKRN